MDLIVVGCGWAGERHVLAAQAMARGGADVRVAALVDSDAEFLAPRAAAWRIEPTFADLPAALAACPEAAGVVIATPHTLHREHTEQAAAAGRHVLVEKPMALSLEDADAMIAACGEAGTTLMVAESARYHRPVQMIREAIAGGRIGRLLSGRMNQIFRGWHSYAYPGRRAWLARPAAGGSGIWMLNGIHQMSVARWLAGEVVEIVAREVHSEQFENDDVEATVVALVTFDSGAVLTLTVSSELHGYRRFGDVVLFGSDGTLEADTRHGDAIQIFTKSDAPTVEAWPSEREGGAPESFVRQLSEFLSAVAEGREPLTGGACERATLAAILAGYESLQTGQPVAPAEL